MDEAARKAIDAAMAAAMGVELAHGPDIRLEPISWLWPGWLARGKLHLLAGAPGQGKTTIAIGLASTVTRARRWPDGTACTRPGSVVIYSGEDDPADTIAPRLLAAGANMERVHFIAGTRIGGEPQPFDPAQDLAGLGAALERIGGADLLIVDPIAAAVTGDSHKNSEVRRSLQPLVHLAAHHRAVIIGITHFSKGGQGADPAQRIIGSVAFTALARVVLVAAKAQDEDGEPRRILARAKSNIGPDDGGIEYDMEQAEAVPGIFATRIRWGQAVAGTAHELLTDPTADDGGDVVQALRTELEGGGPYPSQAVEKSLRAAGFSAKQIRTARLKMGVIVKKNGCDGGWY